MNKDNNGIAQTTITKLLSDPMAFSEMDNLLKTEHILSYMSTATADIITYLGDSNSIITVSYEAKQQGTLRTLIFAKLPTE